MKMLDNVCVVLVNKYDELSWADPSECLYSNQTRSDTRLPQLPAFGHNTPSTPHDPHQHTYKKKTSKRLFFTLRLVRYGWTDGPTDGQTDGPTDGQSLL